jgi:hypothetical protein
LSNVCCKDWARRSRRGWDVDVALWKEVVLEDEERMVRIV